MSEEEKNERISFISTKPELINILRSREARLFPLMRKYMTDWGGDIGISLRSRSHWVGTASYLISGYAIMVLGLLLPGKQPILGE